MKIPSIACASNFPMTSPRRSDCKRSSPSTSAICFGRNKTGWRKWLTRRKQTSSPQ